MSELAELNAVLSAPQAATTAPAPQPQAQPAAETPPVKEPAAPTPSTEPSAPAPTGGTQTETPKADPAPAAPAAPAAPTEDNPENVFTGNRQNQAFAQMRVQNRQLTSMATRLSQVMGLPPNMPVEQLVPIVEQRLLEIEAKANNIPLELAQRLEQAEQLQVQQEQANLRTNAELAFQKVKDSYGLTQAQLVEFAQQLNAAGKNPYAQPMDLLQEYRLLNFDKILEAERKKAVQDAAARQKKAEEQSSTPSKAVGQPSSPVTQIESISALNSLLGGRS